MEVDRIRYIFGSFTRKRQDKKKSPEQGSISAGNSPLRCPRIARPISQNLNVAPRTSAYEDSCRKSVVKEWICGLCKKELVEPRLLGCLHSFCTRCLQSLHQEGEAEVWSEIDAGSIQLDPGETASGGGSAASGYESDLRHSGSEASWDQKPHKYGICTRKISGRNVQLLICPECGYETQLPLGGISALPLNYVLLRRMVATVQEYDRANVLCDLCNSDNKARTPDTARRRHDDELQNRPEHVEKHTAERRCTQCFVSVCTSCSDAHGRHKTTARHSLLPLDPTPTKFCSQHPRIELSVYCATCQQVICRDCCLISHSGHALANASRAAAERARLLRDACDRAKHVPENVHRATRNLNYQAVEIDSKAARVETEVQNWAEEYQRAVEAHGRALCVAAARAREKYRQKLEQKNRELELRAQQAIDAINFAEELMVEATEDELLSLSGPVLRRLERVSELQPLAEAPRCELRFARNAPAAHESTLFGRLLTHAPDPDKCLLNTDGLQDLRVDCQHETTLELRDSSGERIWCGGEQVSGFYRRSDSSARPATARVTDRADGTYSIQFTPRSPGAYLLAITLNNKPIKGSPFPCAARVAKAHAGHFHCCTFCSSGGKRDVTCGCGATMPGGYKGCGHGHAGHPGASHWSCCGSTQRRGLCTNTQSQLYQFSL